MGVDESNVRHQLGRQIEQRRRELEKTRQDVEREGKIASGSVSRFETGERLPSVESMMALCGPLLCAFFTTSAGIELQPL